MLTEVVAQTIREHGWLQDGSTVLVGVSGGPDSMALLHVLHRLAPRHDWRLAAVHVDHGLRGEASREDARYVKARCREWGIPCEVEAVNVRSRMRAEGGNKQAVARELRYDAFYRAAQKWKADTLALAHHADDQVETVLMRLIRGTGISGMTGIPFCRLWKGITIIRPLLQVFREQIEAYCEEHRLQPRQDESNLDTSYTRNRLRWEIIPRLERINPRFKEAVLAHSRMAADEEQWWRKQVTRVMDQVVERRDEEGCVLLVKPLLDLDIALQRRVIKLILNCLVQERTSEITMDAVERVLEVARSDHPSIQVDLPGRVTAAREYQRLWLSRKTGTKGERQISYISPSLPVPGSADLPFFNGRLTIRLKEGNAFPLKESGKTAVFDADRLEHSLRVRNRRPGDRMRPMGLNGTKKVKDILVDAKVHRRLRDRIPLILHGDEIIWIPGVVRSDWAPVTKQTRNTLVLVWEEDLPQE
jgi:tRNA(Ile)-lysidine synthase